ncbi:MAG: ferritin family protein [bacterium]|nr:ferritin family protein [Bacillota bacterium]HHW55421.1 ferritin family protein [Bacillota bacterium]
MKEIIEKALDFEREGHEFYEKLAGEVANPLAKKLFASLAEQEKEHMERIQEIYASDFQVSGQAPGTAENMEETMKQIFHELDESKKRIPLEQLEGYKLAMELEKRGIKMYRELAEKALGEKEKAFFEALAREEREHLTALDNVYRFLVDTSTWHAEEESRVWNWMV